MGYELSMFSMKVGVYLWLVVIDIVVLLSFFMFVMMFVFVRLMLVSMVVGFLLSSIVCWIDYVMLLVVSGLFEWNFRLVCSLNV